ncbi:hypothetical protein [Subsaximicrobium wynnwilliamsii]|uniref:hypothetical protein n=1 Tax=Subsaximicrobium wynnwilliamsii TaxID=291179 RepID=UPI001673961E|nr:hypothetical protein [Subsaximicrobium wynnwilliamsii]
MKPGKSEQEHEKQRDLNKQGLKEQAINIKEKASDGKEINPQVKQKQEKHQPRDNA